MPFRDGGEDSSSSAQRVLITGGCGYIGAHVAVELLDHGHTVTLVDNLSNSRRSVAAAVRRLGRGGRLTSWLVDVLDEAALARVFSSTRFDSVVHCAGVKSVPESIRLPALYYRQNVQGALNVLRAMRDTGVRRIVFSSSATVYGTADRLPIGEACPLAPVSPYGRSKLMVEQMLRDECAADPSFHAVALRYFNPAGAHPAGLIGEAPNGKPNNLFPLIGEVAIGQRQSLAVFGSDYATIDGTCVRDYVHVTDLACAHRLALEGHTGGFVAANLGTGSGHSVMQVVNAYRQASDAPIALKAASRRDGDVAAMYADPSLAARLWGWRAQADLAQMCRDAWHWQAAMKQTAVAARQRRA